MHETIVLAQAAASGNQFLIPGLVFFGVMVYLLVLRPNQQQQKTQASLMASLKKGDDVVTQAGILGKVIQIQDKIITLEIASSLKVRVLKSTIQGKVSEEPVKVAAEEPKDADKKEER